MIGFLTKQLRAIQFHARWGNVVYFDFDLYIRRFPLHSIT